MDFKKHKPTFVSVISVIGIILGIPFGAYCLTLKGGASLGGVLVFGIVIALAVLLAIDRILASFFDPKKLSLIEFGMSVICLLIYFTVEN
ncbi:hypothetical protein [Flavobacterium aciduliphilum]|jgi:hypothetical protein|uniref:Uncharacterized protein n=1 Tax=Flavobacterium aciduliphilum TaxID=1101402 RepID=A0A328Y9N9_9FLAO|nr:hypothetical protein [Flavobacterium aciduliphilum]RAR70629.1 hypothetical protein CLV55_11029 [Flavobacterium aciduliphilum]